MYRNSTITRPSRILAAIAAWTVLWGLCQQAWAVSPTAQELETAKQFAAEKLFSAEAAKLPFSFTYGGKPSAELLEAWQRQETNETLDPSRTKRTIVYSDPQTRTSSPLRGRPVHGFPHGRMDAVLPQHGVCRVADPGGRATARRDMAAQR